MIAPPELFYASNHAPFGDFSSLTGKALKIAEIDQLIHEGKKIDAIKLFRETFGVGLAEAKDAVERMERGESVDISGMRVQSSRAATAEQIEQVKKIGYTIGGSILVTIVASLIVVAGIVIAILYFTWTTIDRISDVTNISTLPSNQTSATPRPTPTPDSVEVLKIGGEGTGAGRFKDNRHVAIDGKGRIYSSDYSPHRIQVFDADGKFLNQWAPESGSNLYDLAADREGNVYLANDKGLFKHEGETGKLIAKSSSIFPRGIAVTWDGKVLVTSRKTIAVLDSGLNLVHEWKDAAESASSTVGFEKLAVDGSGVIYALDDRDNAICKFSPDGKFLNRFKTAANSANAVAIDPKGRLFISDASSIFVVDSEGAPIRKLDASQAFGIAFNQDGDLFIASRPWVIKQKLMF